LNHEDQKRKGKKGKKRSRSSSYNLGLELGDLDVKGGHVLLVPGLIGLTFT